MIRQSIFIITVFFIFVTKSGFGQEALTGLDVNHKIRAYVQEYGKPALKSGAVITLPFFDDFSGKAVYTNPNNWADNNVFINNDYPVFPITAGVATFDAIDENGLLYPNAGDNRFRADYLTSHPIRLDSVFLPIPKALTPADSVYLSFYFQPEGLGFAPSEGDSLVLEFFADMNNDTLSKWVKVWSAPGNTLNDFFQLHNTYFKRVLVPIKDTIFFKPGFRFRFYNIASIRFPTAPSHQSNRDHWNLDYVYLNHSRSHTEKHYRDIAFADRPGSMLASYQAMPYSQYKQNFANEMRDSLRIRVTNLNNTSTTGSYRYIVTRPDGSQIQTYESGTYILEPFAQSGYVSQQAIARPPVGFVFPIAETQPSFQVKHILRSHDNFTPGDNDTIVYHQVFSDYFAYDDGTAEAGYGLTFAGGIIAYRFRLNTPDTLTSLKIFFNRTLNNANQKYFHLNVWNEQGGKPGELIYEQVFYRVEYGDGLNGFYTYRFDDPVYIDNTRFPGLRFFVGIEQTTPDLLNIGFDRNNNNKHNIFYSCSEGWCNTMFDGSLMMRPVLGTKGISGIGNPASGDIALEVFPNPVQDGVLNLKLSDTWMNRSQYQIINLTGSVVSEGATSNRITVSRLPAGMYVLRITNQQHTGLTRFIISK